MAAPRRFALIAAAGTGMRFGGGVPKQYVPLAGLPLLRRSIDALNDAVVLESVFVVLAPDDKLYDERVGKVRGVEALYCGGSTRAESVKNGLAAMGRRAEAEDWVLVHDAVRPCVDVATLNRLLHELEDEPVGGLLAVPLADALKRAETGAGLRAMSTEARDGLWCAQTPQMFRFAILQHAFRNADLARITDEAQAVEALGVRPRLVQGSPLNIKVTYPEDVALAEAILEQRRTRQ
ncbi:MAG TPA: 2-C-methyl-D-erythritol 4-phosphate cytidylyltransferase [Casimicrobiaceae bacterium]|nr:2-C-methyl-D-erythritol 4-phosphate cytidylyltransferase [Casimicrobiaceae bacterium]